MTRSCAGCKIGGESAPSETPFLRTSSHPTRPWPRSRGVGPRPDELVEIKGFGPTRVEKYGDEILAVLGQNDRFGYA